MNATMTRRRTTVKGQPQMPEAVLHNNTSLSLAEVRNLPRYGGFVNEWRQRYVDVYQPSVEFLQKNPETVISVGFNAQTNTTWICVEPFSNYQSRIQNADWSTYR
jgi:hypothetical protein